MVALSREPAAGNRNGTERIDGRAPIVPFPGMKNKWIDAIS